jgi:hypothetical protein
MHTGGPRPNSSPSPVQSQSQAFDRRGALTGAVGDALAVAEGDADDGADVALLRRVWWELARELGRDPTQRHLTLFRVGGCDPRPWPFRKRCGVDTRDVARRAATGSEREQGDERREGGEEASHDPDRKCKP